MQFLNSMASENFMSTQKDEAILSFDAFEGDFGAPGDRILANKIVVARRSGPCAHCAQQIKPGETIRTQASKFDGEIMRHRWCQLCCDAMATYFDDEDAPGEQYEARSHRATIANAPTAADLEKS